MYKVLMPNAYGLMHDLVFLKPQFVTVKDGYINMKTEYYNYNRYILVTSFKLFPSGGFILSNVALHNNQALTVCRQLYILTTSKIIRLVHTAKGVIDETLTTIILIMLH